MIPALLLVSPAFADPPEVVSAARNGTTLGVTLNHGDTGWDHYADAWEVMLPDGTSLGIRELAHPHVDEMPFTRSLRVPDLPTDGRVMIRARCTVTGWSDAVLFRLN